MEQKLVVHRKDGGIHKGVTHDFDPSAERFHLLPAEGGGVPMRVAVEDVKALFWVRDYIGNRDFVARPGFRGDEPARRAIVTFEDGEQIWGTVEADDGSGRGFFLVPADREDNNTRIFVVRSALKDLRMM